MIIFWKEALIAAGISILTESMLIKSKHLPEQFFIIFGSTLFANHILSIEFFNETGPKRESRIFKAPMYTSEAKSLGGFTPAAAIYPQPKPKT